MRLLIAVIVIVLIVIAAGALARSRFLGSLETRVEAVKASAPAAADHWERLPAPVRTYLGRSGVEPGKTYRYFHLEQTGEMKLDKDGWRLAPVRGRAVVFGEPAGVCLGA
jgi:hypothetical protein